MNEAMTIEEAAKAYDVTARSIRNLISSGKIYKHEQDGKALVSCDALEGVFFSVCPVCGDRFRKENQRQRFCGKPCRQKANRATSKKRTARATV